MATQKRKQSKDGLLTICRVTGGDMEDRVRIRVTAISGEPTVFVDIEAFIPEFADALLGHGFRPCDILRYEQEPA